MQICLELCFFPKQITVSLFPFYAADDTGQLTHENQHTA
jgi:hypothetical protein